MSRNDVVSRSSIASPRPRLCTAVEGVEFWVGSTGAKPLKCLITDGALRSHFGALANPDTWLWAFNEHRTDIERRVLAASGRRPDAYVVLINDSEGRLKASAGRCQA